MKEELDLFERKTRQEITIWDWISRVLPLTTLAIISICYFLDYRSWLDIVIQVSSIGFLIVSFVWWYWALFKIAKTIRYLRQSQKNFYDLLTEFRDLKNSIKNNKFDDDKQ
jgi:hypothetical protein